ncbi:MAG: hypothetical protein JWM76_2438 [Pseudonocardiales bacterium]|nr:hypothetical protein [Pseudonocardiales bacterium]
MASPILFFDSHVHFWDPALSQAYPQLAPDIDFAAMGMGRATGMKRRYDPAVYRAEAGSAEITGVVHVTATRGSGQYLGETHRMAGLTQTSGLPTVLVGGFDPQGSIAVIEDELDQQLETGLLAGVRTMERVDYESTRSADILAVVAERGLVFDAVTHPEEMPALAAQLGRNPDATVVIEHTGWPLRAGDPAHSEQWRRGMRALAEVSGNVHCKVSGLAMTLGTFDVGAMRPWIEFALEAFGVDRCFFGSNFPVDAMFGDLTTLLSSYATITAPLGGAAQTALFSENARRVYQPVIPRR